MLSHVHHCADPQLGRQPVLRIPSTTLSTSPRREALDPARPDDPTAAQGGHRQDAGHPVSRQRRTSILWYNVNLQAFRTDKWTGYGTGAGQDGAPFFNLTRATYLDLKPRAAGDRRVASGGCAVGLSSRSVVGRRSSSCSSSSASAAAPPRTRDRRSNDARPTGGTTACLIPTPSGPTRPSRRCTWPRSRCSSGRGSASSRRPRGSSSWRPAARRRPRDRVLDPPAPWSPMRVAACPASYAWRPATREKSLVLDAEPGVMYVHNMGGARDVDRPAHRRRAARDAGATRSAPARVMHNLVNQQQRDVAGRSPRTCPTCSSRCIRTLCSRTRPTRPSAARGSRTRSRRGTCRRWPWPSPARTAPTASTRSTSPSRRSARCARRRGHRRSGRAGASRRRRSSRSCPARRPRTTAPGALSAAIAQQNAEVLAGLVLTQLAAPGTPVYYGPRLSAVDPRSGVVVVGHAETGVASVAAVLLARRYGLACDCYGPCSDSKVVDAQFGYERAVNALLGVAARPRLLSGIGDIQAGVASCLEVARHRRRGAQQRLLRPRRAARGTPTPSTSRRWSTACSRGAASWAPSTRGGTSAASSSSPLLSYRGGLNEWLAAGRGGARRPGRARRSPSSWSASRVGLPDDVLEALCGLIASCAAETGVQSIRTSPTLGL